MANFHFKEFSIQQENTAMKVGTDSILLGSWVPLKDEESILDIGAGTGILALMLAQRSDAITIDAVEIEPHAFEDCTHNFENSPWSDRLFCYHTSIQEFTTEIEDSYDLIIANPPYFNPSDIVSETSRSIARQTHLLNHITLLNAIVELLSEEGSCAFVLPFEMEEMFVKLATSKKLYLKKLARVKDREDASFKRSLLYFTKEETEFLVEEITLKKPDKSYSEQYISLTKDFYKAF